METSHFTDQTQSHAEGTAASNPPLHAANRRVRAAQPPPPVGGRPGGASHRGGRRGAYDRGRLGRRRSRLRGGRSVRGRGEQPAPAGPGRALHTCQAPSPGPRQDCGRGQPVGRSLLTTRAGAPGRARRCSSQPRPPPPPPPPTRPGHQRRRRRCATRSVPSDAERPADE